MNVRQHGCEALSVLADHLDRSVFDADVRKLRKFDGATVSQHDGYPRQVGGRSARAGLAADQERSSHRALDHVTKPLAVDPNPQGILDIGAVQAESPGAGAI